jgi:hypothetical protein
MPEEQARAMTAVDLERWRPQIGLAARQLRGQQQWRERFGAQRDEHLAREERAEDRRIEGEERAEDRRLGGEERAETRLQARRSQDYAQEFNTTHKNDLDIAGLIEDVQESPGGAPPGFFERFRNAWTARGIESPERLEAWQAKHMILEKWARSQSGAAISESEDGRFASQTGLDPASSPEQVDAAFAVLTRLVGRSIRGGAAANRDAARGVIEARGLSDGWLGDEPEARPEKPIAKAKAKPKLELPEVEPGGGEDFDDDDLEGL